MKVPLAALFILTAPMVATPAGSADIPQGTHDWGCEVLLCLSNPAGPTAVAPCVPPIHKLWHELARGHAFPSCTMATGPNGSSYAKQGTTYYDHCPLGTSELAPGQLAQLAAPMPPSTPATPSGMQSTYAAGSSDFTYTGIGSGDGFGTPGDGYVLPPKVCVAEPHGSKVVWSGDTATTVGLYDIVYVSPAQPSNQTIDVYIDDAYWQTVRW